jgi:hypothetical protein
MISGSLFKNEIIFSALLNHYSVMVALHRAVCRVPEAKFHPMDFGFQILSVYEFLMRWLAPTTGIAICQIPVSI